MVQQGAVAASLPVVAYFSMEIALDPRMPTYSGGLGVLAGDYLRAAADSGFPLVGVSLLHRKGYFHQRLDEHGRQTEAPCSWVPHEFLEALPVRPSVTIEGRTVHIRPWLYVLHGVLGHEVPVYLLDTDIPENQPWDRTLSAFLYGGDDHYRLCQEALLGLGGAATLRALGHKHVQSFHMNEGHSALLGLALLQDALGDKDMETVTSEDLARVRHQCVFTTHTPVPAGHDKFPMDMVRKVLGENRATALERLGCCLDGILNMTYLGLVFSRYVNGVSMRHEEIAHSMFPNFPMSAITNGVHAATWASPPFQKLFDRHLLQWRYDNLYLRYAIGIPLDEVQQAHADAKRALLEEVKRRARTGLDPGVLTIGFARRATTHKRANLLFTDLQRLESIARRAGPLQVIYAGKAHPKDEGGKGQIRMVFQASERLRGIVRVIYLEEYDLTLAKFLCSGVDLWLNTPQRPLEASGTSGMKAAINGVPSLSILDGWWLEGCLEGVTGWSIGEDRSSTSDPSAEAVSLYNKLEFAILPMFYGRPSDYASIMRSTIAVNGSYFNAERMVLQYVENAYWPRSA